jgi:hypothetical protein
LEVRRRCQVMSAYVMILGKDGKSFIIPPKLVVKLLKLTSFGAVGKSSSSQMPRVVASSVLVDQDLRVCVEDNAKAIFATESMFEIELRI